MFTRTGSGPTYAPSALLRYVNCWSARIGSSASALRLLRLEARRGKFRLPHTRRIRAPQALLCRLALQQPSPMHAQASDVARGDLRVCSGDEHNTQSDPLLKIASSERATTGWTKEARAFYRMGERADQRNVKAPRPSQVEEARVTAARLHHAGNELQLRIEARRFEVAQMQLHVQAERTATAKAQLAVEKARNQGRRLDIELELQKAAAAAW